jgi:RHS repeat-associated protein
VTTNPLEYAVRDHDATGLYTYRARYYSPALRRFLSEDPAGFGGGDPNLYAYVFNNPLAYTDPPGFGATIWFPPGPGRTWADGPRNGNWGGASWSGGLGRPFSGPPAPPVDSGDECYMNHDNCWGGCDQCPSGRSGCMRSCDVDVVACLLNLSRDPTQWARPPEPGTEKDSRNFRTRAMIYFSARAGIADLGAVARFGGLR